MVASCPGLFKRSHTQDGRQRHGNSATWRSRTDWRRLPPLVAMHQSCCTRRKSDRSIKKVSVDIKTPEKASWKPFWPFVIVLWNSYKTMIETKRSGTGCSIHMLIRQWWICWELLERSWTKNIRPAWMWGLLLLISTFNYPTRLQWDLFLKSLWRLLFSGH